MALTNSQYDSIMRDYQKKQLHNRRVQAEHEAAVKAQLPRIAEIEQELSSLSVSYAKSLLTDKPMSKDELHRQLEELREEKEALLIGAGYDKDYLELPYTCRDCQDTGYIGTTKCHCFRQASIALLYNQSHRKEILQKENFKHFSFQYYSEDFVDASTGLSALTFAKRAYDESQNFVKDFDETCKNLLFYGNTGVGKTFLTNCIARELLDTVHSVIYFSAFELFDVLAKYTFESASSHMADPETDNETAYENILDCDLLIIDDLGTELTNSFVVSKLFLVVNERLLRKKSTIISTNLSIESLVEVYSERTFSRISKDYTMLKMIGNDIRIQKKSS